MGSARERSVREIAESLAANGTYRAALEAPSRQSVVDLWWDAIRAARRLGCEVAITTSDPMIFGEDRALVLLHVQVRPRPVERTADQLTTDQPTGEPT